MMSNNSWLKIVNPILFLSAVIQIITGAAITMGLFASNGRIFSMMTEVHGHNGFIFAGLVLAHISLNWGWIKSQIFKR